MKNIRAVASVAMVAAGIALVGCGSDAKPEATPTVRVTVSGPTETVPGPTETVTEEPEPLATKTIPGPTQTIPGPTVTVTKKGKAADTSYSASVTNAAWSQMDSDSKDTLCMAVGTMSKGDVVQVLKNDQMGSGLDYDVVYSTLKGKCN